MLGAIVDFLFPPHCPLCGAYVEERGHWCSACLQKNLRPREIPLPVPMRTVLHSVWALSLYRGGMKKLITELKFNGRKDRLPYISSFLTAVGKDAQIAELLAKQQIAVPIPLHPAKLKQRGFNQVELMFAPFCKKQQLSMQNILQRDRESKPMYQLNPEERRENLAGIFSVRPGVDVRDKRILLLDDILATGTTFYEAAVALKAVGASKIDALVLATDH